MDRVCAHELTKTVGESGGRFCVQARQERVREERATGADFEGRRSKGARMKAELADRLSEGKGIGLVDDIMGEWKR